MPRVEFTPNLHRHLDCPAEQHPGSTARQVLENYFAAHPGVRRYILDDQGGMQRHIVAFVDGNLIRDRKKLSDPVAADQTLFVFQALSGG